MKILFVTNAWGVSGAEEHLLDLAGWLAGNGASPVFLVREDGLLCGRLKEMGIPFRTNARAGVRKLLSPVQVAKAIAAERPDVVSVNREHDILLAWAAGLIAAPVLRARPRLVAVLHTPTGRRHAILSRCDGVVCTSKFTADAFLASNPGIDGKLSVIHYGIRPIAVDPAAKGDRDRPRRFFRGRGFPIIGMVGELWKNQEELVDAAALIAREFPAVTVAIVGGGWPQQSEALAERVRRNGLGANVVLTGRVDRGIIPDVFFDCDLSVSTHRNEGFGIVHIESLACLTPVVAYNVGGYVEMLRDGGGVLVDGGTEEFARAVTGLLGDDARREALGIEGRRIVEGHYRLDRMGERHLDYYRRIAES